MVDLQIVEQIYACRSVLPAQLCRRYGILVIKADAEMLQLISAQALSIEQIDDLRFMSRRRELSCTLISAEDYAFYTDMALATGVYEDYEPMFAFRCPKRWFSLTPRADPRIRHCGVCDKDVHFCSNDEEVQAAREQGICAALIHYEAEWVGLIAPTPSTTDEDWDNSEATDKDSQTDGQDDGWDRGTL